MNAVTLTDCQEQAKDFFFQFLTNPDMDIMVLEGYAGTGKTTLVNHLLDTLPKWTKARQLVQPEYQFPYHVELAATTNKAAEALEQATGRQTHTIYHLLSLVVKTDYKTGETSIAHRKRKGAPEFLESCLVFVDEISYADVKLLTYIRKLCKRCKIVLIGDPAQLAPIKHTSAPAFFQGYPTVRLTNIVRQAKGSPIMDLSTGLREAVMGGEFPACTPDGASICHLERGDFEQEVIKEFTRPDWSYQDSKVLAWTNKTVINYNQGIRQHAKGAPELQPGDYAICNHFIGSGGWRIKTDQLVHITRIQPGEELGVEGWDVVLNQDTHTFMPRDWDEARALVKRLRANNRLTDVRCVEETWADLRAAYSCTINKSQGSTFDRVFIDLDDLGRCNQMDNLLRLLYVGVSRARSQVVFTGDLV